MFSTVRKRNKGNVPSSKVFYVDDFGVDMSLYPDPPTEALTAGLARAVREGWSAILVTPDVYDQYRRSLCPWIEYQDIAHADAGFENVTYKGVPVIARHGGPPPGRLCCCPHRS